MVNFFGLAFAGFSLIPLVTGAFLIKKGSDLKGTGEAIKQTETTKVSELRPGTVEIKGTARPIEGVSNLKSPIKRHDALADTVVVKEYHSGGSDSGGSWKTIYQDDEAVPFVVDDGTGKVKVDPRSSSERRINVELDQKKVSGGNKPPRKIQEFIEREQEVDKANRGSIGPLDYGQRRRYSEGYIEPGEEVYILGKAREIDKGWDERGYVIDGPTETGDFVISDKSEEQLVKEGKWGGLLLYIVGGIALFMGVIFLLVSVFFLL